MMSPELKQVAYSIGQIGGLLHHRPKVRTELADALRSATLDPEVVRLVRDLLTMVLADAGAEPSPLK